MNHLNRYLLVTILVLSGHILQGQGFSVIGEDYVCYDSSQPLRLSDIVSIQGDDAEVIQGLQISIVSPLDGTDSFSYQGSGAISGNYDANLGILELSGNATIAQYKTALEQSFFHTTSPENSKSINVTISGVDFLYETGHFYQFFSAAGISWSQAKSSAENRSLYGLQGYLTTITLASENSFILARVSGTAWIGASDEAIEGVWRWVTGPEGQMNGGQGMLLTDGFRNWNNAEPNNVGNNEHYAHMMDWTTPPGKWNDLPNAGGGGQFAPTGYIVEYGGMPGEPNVLENLSKTIVMDPERSFEIEGAISVCPNIRGVEYSVEDAANHSYTWTVSGGNIVSGQGTSSIIVDWFDTNPSASVSLNISSNLVCEYNLNLGVKVNEQLAPPLPDGPSEVCFINISEPQTYITPYTNGSKYKWHISNGTFVNGDTTNQVQVLWNGSGTGSIYFTESTETATDICDGDSPVLPVELKEEIVAVLATQDVKCFGGSEGSASVQSVNGTADFEVVWNTLGAGIVNGKQISNLPAGTYSAEITYKGCTINEAFTITQPTELMGTLDATDATCYGAANGTAMVNAEGGTGNYSYTWSHNRNSRGSFVANVPVGNHSVDVRDENECVLTLNFTVSEPPILKIDSIASQKASCPQLADGELEAFVSGGTAPYTYTWTDNSSAQALATGFAKGEYQLVVTDANGCTTSSSQIVEEAIPKIVLPNAFSPNGDNANDTFRPASSCPVEYQLTVYSRWGTVVFHTTNVTDGWNGTFEGSPAPEGKYSYFASWVIEANGQTTAYEKRGDFRLIR